MNSTNYNRDENIIDILNDACDNNDVNKETFFLEFLEYSPYSITNIQNGLKPKEGYILKMGITRKNLIRDVCLAFLDTMNMVCYQKRWFILKDDMICYLDNHQAIKANMYYTI